MKTLLEYRERIKIFLGKYDIYIFPVVKFILAFAAFMLINTNIGFVKQLASPLVALLLALLCSFLPTNAIVVFAALLVLLHSYELSLEVMGISFVVVAVMFLLFFRTAPKYGYLLVITPMAFGLKIPYLIPLAMGLIGTPVTAIPVACGTISYYLIHFLKTNANMLSGSDESTVTETITYFMDNVITNREMLLTIVAFALTLIIVYVIRRMKIDYSWSIAIGVGTVVDFIVILTGSLFLGVSIKFLPVILGSLVSAALALALQLSVFGLDYTRTEYVQFEDDDYYYYVKAVPKFTISVPEKKVKKISTRKTAQQKRRSTSARKQTPHTSQSAHRRREEDADRNRQ